MPLPYTALAEDGAYTAVVTYQATANTVVSKNPGFLGRVLVTQANGAAAILIYDSTSSSSPSGTIVGVVPASAAAGSVYTFGMPVTYGITVAGAATNGALTVSYY